jgi:hypothetical protein
MSDTFNDFRDFEARLGRLFSEPPAFADADDFARSVVARLDRGWQLRSLVIGLTGLIGGTIGVSQMMAVNLFGQIESVSAVQGQRLGTQLGQIFPTHLALPSLPFGGEGLWMSAGLAAVAVVFALTRALEEI